MKNTDFREPLSEAVGRLRRLGVVPAVADALATRRGQVYVELRDTILAQIPAFHASGNPDILPDLGRHTEAHLEEIQRLLGGGRTGEFTFVDEHARHRAEQRFPLEATLHAYRCGHKVVARWIRDAAMESGDESASVGETLAAIADFAIEYTDAVSTKATSAYVARTRELGEDEGGRRSELLSVLLGGYDESDGRVANLLRRAGYLQQRQSYCVVVARPVDPKEMQRSARALRLVDTLSSLTARLPVRTLSGQRDDLAVAVISATRRTSGWTVPQTALAERLYPALLQAGTAVVIGISNDAPSTAHLPNALAEARTALEFADVAHRVVSFSDIPLKGMLLRRFQDDPHVALPQWADALYAADEKSKGALSATLRAYADADMNVLKAARLLKVHPNTIYARMQKLNGLTRHDALGYHGLTELLLATECRRKGADSS
ncbi:MAG: helix-turn-helix domain-containing protein [Gammaproteobacteria bacterium]|nr:helix-turn-helix domain-containing protein [Gammaproteobacteria bacterium]